MIVLRRIAWVVMWCGLLLAISVHRDVLNEPSDRALLLFGIALAGIIIGLAGAYFTRKATDDGWGP